MIKFRLCSGIGHVEPIVLRLGSTPYVLSHLEANSWYYGRPTFYSHVSADLCDEFEAALREAPEYEFQVLWAVTISRWEIQHRIIVPKIEWSPDGTEFVSEKVPQIRTEGPKKERLCDFPLSECNGPQFKYLPAEQLLRYGRARVFSDEVKL